MSLMLNYDQCKNSVTEHYIKRNRKEELLYCSITLLFRENSAISFHPRLGGVIPNHVYATNTIRCICVNIASMVTDTECGYALIYPHTFLSQSLIGTIYTCK